ncbi:MAG: hypothetical protein KGJ60_12185, partial [Verrucomicrobiota bacterium]|nr:hypothetical protein [Verrucomicrobiota bacterium]
RECHLQSRRGNSSRKKPDKLFIRSRRVPTLACFGLSALYPIWSSSPPTVFADIYGGVGGLEVNTYGFGSLYYQPSPSGIVFPSGFTALSTNDTEVILTFTVNPTPDMAASGLMFYTNYNWIGTLFYINLDSGVYHLIPPGPNYCGWNNPGNPPNVVWSGSNVTWTIDLTSQTNFLAYTQGGTNHFYGFNIGIDPAVIFNTANSGGNQYDITFNSIEFLAPAPAPPKLSIGLVGTNVVVSWPATGSYSLQQSANLASFSWSPWGFPPSLNNGTNTVTIPTPTNTLFFRLSNP